ncbi:MAG: hypothetical protein DHS20C18_26550 [Saprospiraceae bacterium]|nr:MAG: hypothetical protein DHS20C18_26550 [Saprospiraceae bacterium]
MPNCLNEGFLTVDPLPDSETLSYAPGTTVDFCYTVAFWSDGESNEWLHAVEVQFGVDWDLSTIMPIPPPSCSQTGIWGWYDNWTSFNTGITFGPGFAFDSNIGGPMDGNPGNNFGDGPNGCNLIGQTAAPLTFCWSIQVDEDAPPGESSGLVALIDVLSDGRSGAWMNDQCSSMIDYIFFPPDYYEATVLHISNTNNTCDSACTGQLFITTLDAEWQHRLLDNFGNIIMEDTFATGIDTINNLCPGDYTLESSSLSNNIVYENTFSISNLPTPTAIASFEEAVCFNESPLLYGDVTDNGTFHVTYHWQGPNGYTSTQRNPTNGPGSGTYILTTAVGNCFSEPDTVIVPAYPFPALIVSPGPQVTICPGETVQLSASGGQVYRWYSGDDLIIISPTLNIAPTTTTLYSVIGPVQGAICEGYGEVLVTVNDFAAQDLGPDRNICLGESLTLGSADASLLYEWSTGENVSPITVSPTIPTTYVLTVTNAQGCGAEYEVLITPVTTPSVTIETNNTSICSGDSTLLIANYSGGTPPYTFAWSTGQNTENIWVGPDSATEYNLTVTDSNGCSGIASINVTVEDDQVTIIATDTIICIGETVNLSVDGFFDAYMWSIGAATSSIDIDPTISTLYWITVTTSNGCNLVDSIFIEVVPFPTAPIINCSSTLSSVTFSWNPEPNVTYEASSISGPNGIQTDNMYTVSGLSPNETVSIQVLATNSDNCQQISQQTCSAIDCPLVNLEVGNDIAVCQDAAPFLLEVIVNGGNGNGTINWQGPCIIDAAIGLFDPQVCGVGNHNLLVSYTEGPCSYQANMVVTVLPSFQADFLVDNLGCIADTIEVQYTGDAPSNADFSWDFAGANVLSGSDGGPYTLQWNTTGDKELSLFIDGDCPGAIFSQTITIEAPYPAPDLACTFDVPANTLSFNWNEIPDADGYELTLNGTPMPSTTNTEWIFDTFAPGEEVTVTVAVLNSGPCINEVAQVTCAIPVCPTLVISAESESICTGASTILQADYGDDASYSWSPGTGLSCTDCADPIVSPSTSTTYILTATNSLGCQATDSITISVDNLPTELFNEPILDVCRGITVELCLNINAQKIIWTGPNNYYFENNCLIITEFDSINSGTYYANVTLLDGCILTDSITLSMVPPLTVLQATDQIEACPFEIFTLSAEVANADFYYWYPQANVFCQNCPTTLANISQPTVFTLIVLNDEGCELQLEIPATIPAGCAQHPDYDDPIFLSSPGNNGPTEMLVYPNPGRDVVTVQWDREVKGILQVFDTKGQRLQQHPVADRVLMLDLQALPSGVYWIRLVSDSEIISRKILKE